ncbi:MAG TPA: sialidase family protein, partial [Roseiflexaceae bacterium]|nr:sialidase family protein [Roseiflexaceae bacterium]
MPALLGFVLIVVRVEAAPGGVVLARLAAGVPVNASQRAGNQTEPTIAVNPANPQQVVVFSNDTASVPGLFAAVSGDGGRTWDRRSIFGSGSTAACCDAQATFDRFGNLFLTYLGSDRNVYLAASFDAGQTFGVLLALTSTGDADQPAVAAGPGSTSAPGSVWVSYFNGAGTAARTVPVAGLGALGALSPEQVAPGSLGAYGDVEVGPSGQVLITYQRDGPTGAGPSQIVVHLDGDGSGPAPFGAGVVVSETQVGTARRIPTTSNSLGVDAEANLA